MKTYCPPPSKSMTHRALIILSKCDGKAEIENMSICDDTLATKKAIESIFDRRVYCKDSASTLRLMIPQAFGLGFPCVFDGSYSLSKRPMDAYFDFFDENNIEYEVLSSNEGEFLPLRVKGGLEAGDYKISASKSSQFASGLMLYLGGVSGKSSIELMGKVESFDYIQMTSNMMNYFGRKVEIKDNLILISDGKYQNKKIKIEADYSQTSYFIALGLLNEGLKIKNLNKNSIQADRRIIDIVRKMNGKIYFENTFNNENNSYEDILVVEKSDLKACEIDVSECPDLAPTLAFLLSLASGKSLIKGCKRLVYKESDRLNNTAKELNKLGAKILVKDDMMIIDGVKKLYPAKLDSHNDHRIAMMLSIANTVIDGDVEIKNKDCVSKSYPNFYKDLNDVCF